MATRRKLFLTHAGELAHRLMRDVEHEGLVAQFVRAYAERYGRYGLLSDDARLPDLESTIGREALLVMAADLPRILPQAFTPGPRGMLRPDDGAFVEAFYTEFLASLERGMNRASGDPVGRGTAEGEMFRRDLEMYRRWGQRPAPALASGSGAPPAHAGDSPFRDRCALLLDPAMMEQARREAANFESEMLRVMAQRFRQLGRFGRVTANAPKRSALKATRRRVSQVRSRKAQRRPQKNGAKKLLEKSPKRARSKKPSKIASRPVKPLRREKRKPVVRRKLARR